MVTPEKAKTPSEKVSAGREESREPQENKLPFEPRCQQTTAGRKAASYGHYRLQDQGHPNVTAAVEKTEKGRMTDEVIRSCLNTFPLQQSMKL